MISQVNHISFTVSDLNRSVEFYRDAFGLELVSLADRTEEFSAGVSGIPGAMINVAYMKAPNCALELIQYIGGAGVKIDTATNNVGSAHVAFNSNDFDNDLKRALDCGARQAGKVMPVPGGPNKGKPVVYIEDPDGNTIEFVSDTVPE